MPGLGLSMIELERSRSRTILGDVCFGSGVNCLERSCLVTGGTGPVRVMIGDRRETAESGLEDEGVVGEPQGSGVLGRPRSRIEVVEGEGEMADLTGGEIGD